MIRIGEESGNTEEMLDKLADYYDEEVEMSVQSLMAAMEPMIIIVLAVVVGGLIAACMMPMMQMYTALDSLFGLSVLCRDRTIIKIWGGKLTTLKLKNT